MFISEWRYFAGPSVHAHRPVIEAVLDLQDLADRPTSAFSGLPDNLLTDFPGLADHHCGLGYAGGFAVRLREGTFLGHVVEHVALEILTKAGQDVTWGKTRQVGPTTYRVIFQAPSASLGRDALGEALSWVEDRARGVVFEGPLRRQRVLDKLAKLALGPSTAAIGEAAGKRGIPLRRLSDGSLLQLGWGIHARRVEATLSDGTSAVGVDVASDKALTKALLLEAGLPVPEGAVVSTVEEGLQVAEGVGWPLVTKPLDGSQGDGVSVGITSRKEFRRAFQIARDLAPQVLVERYVPGRQFRFLVVGEEVVAVSERLPATVMGDGVHTIQELIDTKNEDPRRGDDHDRPLSRIHADAVVLMSLGRRRLALGDIPPAGEEVRLREAANLSTGGTAVDRTAEAGATLKRMAVMAAGIVGLDIAGVDIIAPAPGGDIRASAVLEVNACPGIRMHEFPSEGLAQKAGEAVVRHLFPSGDGRIPVVGVTGTNGKSTTVRLIAHILKAEGLRVGTTTTDGIEVGEETVREGDSAGPKSGRLVLSDRTVEAAVLEVARGGILREGLPYDRADVGVLLNIGPDHLGMAGVRDLGDLAHVKSLVIEATAPGGAAVLNADDPWVLGLKARANAPVILFSRRPESLAVRRHRREGGRVVFFRNGHIVLSEGPKETYSFPAAELPFTFRGRSRAMVEDAMAAVAAGWGLGKDPNVMAVALRSFRGGASMNPGRFNLYGVGDVQVLLDYGHNLPAVEAAIETARLLAPRRLVGVVGVPGDRRDEDITLLGRTVARGFDRLILKEDKDLRGRAPGEVLDLLNKGASRQRQRPQKIEIVPDEVECLSMAILTALPGDLIVCFYEKLAPLLAVIEEGKAARTAGVRAPEEASV